MSVLAPEPSASAGAQVRPVEPEAPQVPERVAPDREAVAALCRQIADDIEALKPRFPSLADFRASSAIRKEDCQLGYTYRCHPSTARGGWTAGVPEPDPDGVWFYLSLWDERDDRERMAQINTQPMMRPKEMLGERRVTFLALEGAKGKGVGGEIRKILAKRGMK